LYHLIHSVVTIRVPTEILRLLPGVQPQGRKADHSHTARERVGICEAISPLPRTPSRRAQSINICRNMKNSGQCHGLQRNTGWTRNACHYMQQSVGIDKNFITVYCRQEVADNPPSPPFCREIDSLFIFRALTPCQPGLFRTDCSWGRNHMQPATQQN